MYILHLVHLRGDYSQPVWVNPKALYLNSYASTSQQHLTILSSSLHLNLTMSIIMTLATKTISSVSIIMAECYVCKYKYSYILSV